MDPGTGILNKKKPPGILLECCLNPGVLHKNRNNYVNFGIAVKRHADAGGRGTYGYILNVDVDIYSES